MVTVIQSKSFAKSAELVKLEFFISLGNISGLNIVLFYFDLEGGR